MATQRGRKPASRRSNSKRNTSARRTQEDAFSAEIRQEITLWFGIAATLLLFLCNFHIIGTAGNVISSVMFGLFGLLAYIFPLVLFLGSVFLMVNLGSRTATIKLIAALVLFFDIDAIIALLVGLANAGDKVKQIYHFAAHHIVSGGLFGTLLAKGLAAVIGIVGSIILLMILFIACLVLMTEKSFSHSIAGHGRRVYETALEDMEYRRERNEEYRQQRLLRQQERQERLAELEKQEEQAAAKPPKKRRVDKKVSGMGAGMVTLEEAPKKVAEEDLKEITAAVDLQETSAQPLQDELDAIHIKGLQEITYEPEETPAEVIDQSKIIENKPLRKNHKIEIQEAETEFDFGAIESMQEAYADRVIEDTKTEEAARQISPATEAALNGSIWATPSANANPNSNAGKTFSQPVSQSAKPEAVRPEAVIAPPKPKPKRPYRFPKLDLLNKNPGNGNGDSEAQLKETARLLKETLKTFGVNVTITDISQGPSVTRYELQPELGVKVSKIVNLADDIKLNLAATDIRIEAPIPGKAAIGIEVPNKVNSAVYLRDLLSSKEFKNAESKISFAVGKDIAGSTIVTDIGKMPHVLIAGSTGSGKSVCINTLIMSILYKASPEEVKLILVDPKVVELSVYNGIPHLLLPVVTDPKKAAAALQWGVKEMTERYKKFEDMHVRDLKGYNKKVKEMTSNNGEELPETLPQIVIIVDELADLMMVASGDVEESICRLAQLARAAGIHLVIATQRPSVDVITGLIKANMPSRVAFAVSSGTDSRTILDMNGAEKLLGKGDMLFYPQGYPKPARVQGAFVSDGEVAAVVEDIIKNNGDNSEEENAVAQQISAMGSGQAAGGAGGADEYDAYLIDAGRFIVEKEKASSGMLQRAFKIGFNRAARIMDQLCELGVVGEEEGTKPRRVLMTKEQFEQFAENFQS